MFFFQDFCPHLIAGWQPCRVRNVGKRDGSDRQAAAPLDRGCVEERNPQWVGRDGCCGGGRDKISGMFTGCVATDK